MLSQFLERLAIADTDKRRQVLITILDELKAPYTLHHETIGKYHPQNIAVPLHNNSKYVIVGAHYDAVPNSTGANDNASGMAVMLALLQAYLVEGKSVPVEFVFFDLEEMQMQGSHAYAKRVDPTQVIAMLNLDIVGVGDTLLVSTGGRYTKNTPVEKAARDCMQTTDFRAQAVSALPPSDDLYFEGYGMPALSICAVPQVDIQPMQDCALAMHNGDLIETMPTVFETMHNRSRDHIKAVQASALHATLTYVKRLLAKLMP